MKVEQLSKYERVGWRLGDLGPFSFNQKWDATLAFIRHSFDTLPEAHMCFNIHSRKLTYFLTSNPNLGASTPTCAPSLSPCFLASRSSLIFNRAALSSGINFGHSYYQWSSIPQWKHASSPSLFDFILPVPPGEQPLLLFALLIFAFSAPAWMNAKSSVIFW